MCVCKAGFFSFYIANFLYGYLQKCLEYKSGDRPLFVLFFGSLLVFLLQILQVILFIIDVVIYPLQLIVKK